MHQFMRNRVILIFIFSAVVSFSSRICAQDTNAEFQLRLAQSFEQAGEWDRAAVVYGKLHDGEPDNEIYFEGLQRAYMRLRAYDKAIALVSQRLQSQPTNVNLLSLLGGIYSDAGLAQKADSTWHRVIEINPKNIGLYRVVASQMLEHRMFPEAINTYLAARTATGNENVFAEDLASLYTVLQEYDGASREFIRVLNAYPQQLPFVESRIGSFTIRDTGLRAAIDVTRDAVKNAPNNITVRKLYAWLAMEGNDYRTAFEEYRTIDRLSNSYGAELLDFAGRASKEGSHLVASQAYRDVLESSPNPVLVSAARYGYARQMEDLSTEADSAATTSTPPGPQASTSPSARVSETEKGFQQVVQLYEAVIKDYPNTELAAQSYYRIGVIRMERFADFNGALESFQKSRAASHSVDLIGEASQRTADVYVLQNNLPSALAEYQSMLHIPSTVYQQQAQFGIADLVYFEGKFDSSLAELKPVVTNLGSDLSNDGLLLQYFILENKGSYPAALKEYAGADLLMKQEKYSESLAAFSNVIHNFPTALLVDDATLKIAELQLKLNLVSDALSTFQHIVTDMPESILRDRAQMRIAETYERRLKDKPNAIAAYEKILVKFPNSLYVEQARKRIRLLRGDAS